MIIKDITDLEYKLIKQALKIWRGDFPIGEYPNDRPAYPSILWNTELTQLINKLEDGEHISV